MTLTIVVVRRRQPPPHSVPTADILRLRLRLQEPRQVLDEPLRRTTRTRSTPPQVVAVPAQRFGREAVIATSLILGLSTAPIRLLRWYRVEGIRISGRQAMMPAAVAVAEAPSIAIFPAPPTGLLAGGNKAPQTAAPPRMVESWHTQRRPRTLMHRRLPSPCPIPIDRPERIAMHRTCTGWPGTAFVGRERWIIICKIRSAFSLSAKIKRK
mmetsp:Transcript_29125/g.68225  ORF Transcript_29125/g.68225 Transcript_29125/m.68225 type:complete len:211 (-) Transcript_29125:2068-2700(-)